MKRLIASAFAFAFMVGILCIPAVFYDIDFEPADMASDPTTITSYKADFTVDEDGGIDVVETLTVNFPISSLHGIFRFFDRQNPSDPDIRHIVEDFEVTADGEESRRQAHGRAGALRQLPDRRRRHDALGRRPRLRAGVPRPGRPDRGRQVRRHRHPVLLEPDPVRLGAGHRAVRADRAPAGAGRRGAVLGRRRRGRRQRHPGLRGRGRRHQRPDDSHQGAELAHTRHDRRRPGHGDTGPGDVAVAGPVRQRLRHVGAGPRSSSSDWP